MMVEFDLKTPQRELTGRLQRLMFLRVLFVSLLLGVSIILQVRETQTYFGDIQTSHYFVISTIYFLTLVYVILLKYLIKLSILAYIQLLVDTVLVTAIIYATGGMDSIFSFLYILTIINGSMILYRKGGLIIATVSSILYGVLLNFHYHGIIHPFGSRMLFPVEFQAGYVSYMILVNTVAFYLVAFLSSFLSEQAMKSRVELRSKQDDIVELEALNERIIRSITSGLITLDGQMRIILFNPSAEEIFGLQARETIGKKIEDIIPSLAGPLKDGSGYNVRGPRKPRAMMDFPYQRADGDELYLRFSLSPLSLPSSGQEGHLLVFQDMTEMKRIEEEMKRVEGLALIGELAAGIAHEIRNPMASISGSIQMLKEGLDTDDVNQRLMDIILREINRLNHLVSDFLLFARPKPLNIQAFDLNRLIEESFELFRSSGKWTEKVHVKTYFPIPITIESDSAQIRQVLWNLILNACESMTHGGTLYIYTDIVEIDRVPVGIQKMAKIIIRDTGNGFGEKALAHIFTPFFTTKEGGSGLGLAIVKSIVEGLQGKIYGENHPEGGAVVTLYLHPNLKKKDSSDADSQKIPPLKFKTPIEGK